MGAQKSALAQFQYTAEQKAKKASSGYNLLTRQTGTFSIQIAVPVATGHPSTYMTFEIIAALIFATHIAALGVLVMWFSSGCPSSLSDFWAQAKGHLATLLPFRPARPVKPPPTRLH